MVSSLRRAWLALGHAMSRVTTPIVLAVIFFVLITPIAFVLRLFGRDELRLRKHDATSRPTYWIERTPAGPHPDSYRHPF